MGMLRLGRGCEHAEGLSVGSVWHRGQDGGDGLRGEVARVVGWQRRQAAGARHRRHACERAQRGRRQPWVLLSGWRQGEWRMGRGHSPHERWHCEFHDSRPGELQSAHATPMPRAGRLTSVCAVWPHARPRPVHAGRSNGVRGEHVRGDRAAGRGHRDVAIGPCGARQARRGRRLRHALVHGERCGLLSKGHVGHGRLGHGRHAHPRGLVHAAGVRRAVAHEAHAGAAAPARVGDVASGVSA